MPAVDQCEPQVIRAFEKAGWQVIANPLSFSFRNTFIYADLHLQNLNQQTEMMVAEVKCFPSSRSQLDELYHAIGQYHVYREAISENGYDMPLYLVVPQAIYKGLLSATIIENTLKRAKIDLVIVHLGVEEITQWIIW